MSNEDHSGRDVALSLLSPEELAALKEDEVGEDERAVLESLAAEDDDGSDETDVEAKEDESKAEAKEEPAEKKADEPAPTDDEVIRPARYSAELPENIDEQLSAIDIETDSLAEQFEAGEISAKDFLAKQREIGRKREGLIEAKNRATIFSEINEQNARQEWINEVNSFMRRIKKEDGTDYRGDKKLEADLDMFVKTIAGREENVDMSYDEILYAAHTAVKSLHGLGKKAPAPEKGDKQKVSEATAARKPKLDALPKTIAEVPGSDGPGDVGDDEFAKLDSLEGMEYETALASLPAAVRARYLAA